MRKSNRVLEKFWQRTVFHVLAQPGKKEGLFLEKSLQRIMSTFSQFQKSMLTHMTQLFKEPLHIIGLSHIRNEIGKIKGRMERYLELESEKFGTAFAAIGQFRYVNQVSEMKALKQYTEKISYYTNDLKNASAMKGVKKLQDTLITAKFAEMIQIRDSARFNYFERWLADFDFRSKEYFHKIYAKIWENEPPREKNASFVKLRDLSSMSDLVFPETSHPFPNFKHGQTDKGKDVLVDNKTGTTLKSQTVTKHSSTLTLVFSPPEVKLEQQQCHDLIETPPQPRLSRLLNTKQPIKPSLMKSEHIEMIPEQPLLKMLPFAQKQSNVNSSNRKSVKHEDDKQLYNDIVSQIYAEIQREGWVGPA